MFKVFREQHIHAIAELIMPLLVGNYSSAQIGNDFHNLKWNFDCIHEDMWIKQYRGENNDIDRLVLKVKVFNDMFYEGNLQDFLEFLLYLATSNRRQIEHLLHYHFISSGLEVWSNHSLEYIVVLTKFYSYLTFGDWHDDRDRVMVPSYHILQPISLETHYNSGPWLKSVKRSCYSTWLQDLSDTMLIGLNDLLVTRVGSPKLNMTTSTSDDMLDQLSIKSRIVLAALILLANNEN
jgi:hypothetical protein